MPITSSAKKALRQSIKRRARNIVKKDAYKKALKTYRTLVTDKSSAGLDAALAKAFQALDKAAKSGVIKKNKASRLKSRLAAHIPKK